jgi:hypothetical protein
MNDQGQLTQEFNSTSNEFIEVGIRCLDAAEKSIRKEKTAASSSTTRSTLSHQQQYLVWLHQTMPGNLLLAFLLHLN